jgi:hypothetical protein
MVMANISKQMARLHDASTAKLTFIGYQRYINRQLKKDGYRTQVANLLEPLGVNLYSMPPQAFSADLGASVVATTLRQGVPYTLDRRFLAISML